MQIDTLIKYARPRAALFTTASTAAETTYVSLRPASDTTMFLVLAANGYHEAGANRNGGWQYQDAIRNVAANLYGTQSVVTATRWSLFSDMGNQKLMIPHGIVPATYDVYPRFFWGASGAAENAYIQAIILEVALGSMK